MKKLMLIGGGGFARECLWLIRQINAHQKLWDLKGIVAPQKPTGMKNVPYLGTDEEVLQQAEAEMHYSVAIGDPIIRRQTASLYEASGMQAASLIHPGLRISPTVQIGSGSILCAGVQLTVHISIGQHVIVNLNSTIGHETQVEDFCTLSPACNLSGAVRLGSGVFLGSGTNVLPGINVSSGITIGAGALVNRNLSEAGTYVGVPVQKLPDQQ